MSQDQGRIEAEGATLGEAKWAAVKALEPSFPGITADYVTFEILEEAGDDSDARVSAAGRRRGLAERPGWDAR